MSRYDIDDYDDDDLIYQCSHCKTRKRYGYSAIIGWQHPLSELKLSKPPEGSVLELIQLYYQLSGPSKSSKLFRMFSREGDFTPETLNNMLRTSIHRPNMDKLCQAAVRLLIRNKEPDRLRYAIFHHLMEPLFMFWNVEVFLWLLRGNFQKTYGYGDEKGNIRWLALYQSPLYKWWKRDLFLLQALELAYQEITAHKLQNTLYNNPNPIADDDDYVHYLYLSPKEESMAQCAMRYCMYRCFHYWNHLYGQEYTIKWIKKWRSIMTCHVQKEFTKQEHEHENEQIFIDGEIQSSTSMCLDTTLHKSLPSLPLSPCPHINHLY